MRWQLNVYAKWITIIPLIGLCGCSSVALNRDSERYAKVYAEASDRQLLLNLARLSKDEPVYFIQLATIGSQYSFGTSVGITPSYVFGHTPAMLGGNFMASRTVTPNFQFLPISGTNFVQAILSPISANVGFTLYDQGYPADLVARTIIASVQKQIISNSIMITNIIKNTVTYPITNLITYPITNIINNSITYPITNAVTYPITNTITYSIPNSVQYSITNSFTNYEFYVNDPNDPTYPKFLEFCNQLRSAQLCHVLNYQKNSTKATIYSGSNAKLADVLSANSSGLSVTNDNTNGHVTVAQTLQSSQLMTNNIMPSDYSDYEAVFDTTNETAHTYDNEDADTKLARAQTFAHNYQEGDYILKTRTFEAAMFTVAKQEVYFNQLEKKQKEGRHLPYPHVTFTNDAYGSYATIFRTNNTQYTVRPIMTITYGSNKPSHFSKLIDLDYDGDEYLVGDADGATQNKTVFTILSYLFAQTAINTQNLPVQQLIQVQ